MKKSGLLPVEVTCIAAAFVAVFALVGCSGVTQQNGVYISESGQNTVAQSEQEELTDEEIADIATEYIGSEEILHIRELHDTIIPIARSLTDGTFDGEYEALDEAVERCNAVIDMEDAPECISDLHDAFVDRARNYRSAVYSLISACSDYEMGLSEYTEDLNDFLSHYDDVRDSLEDVLYEYGDIVRRSEGL